MHTNEGYASLSARIAGLALPCIDQTTSPLARAISDLELTGPTRRFAVQQDHHFTTRHEPLIDDPITPRMNSRPIKRINETSVRDLERWLSIDENQHKRFRTTNPINDFANRGEDRSINYHENNARAPTAKPQDTVVIAQDDSNATVTLKLPSDAILRLPSTSGQDGKLDLLIDSGAITSIAKEKAIKSTSYFGSIRSYTGFGGLTQSSSGTTNVSLRVGTRELTWPMQVFDNLGPTRADGIIGRDFLKKRVIMNWVDETISIRTNHNESLEPSNVDNNVSFFEPSGVTIEEITDNEKPTKESDINRQTITAIAPSTGNGQNRVTHYETTPLYGNANKFNAIELLEQAKFKINSLEERIKDLLSSTALWNTEVNERSSEIFTPDEESVRREIINPPTSDARDVVVRPSEMLFHESVEEAATEPRDNIDYVMNIAAYHNTPICEDTKSETSVNILDPSVILVINDEDKESDLHDNTILTPYSKHHVDDPASLETIELLSGLVNFPAFINFVTEMHVSRNKTPGIIKHAMDVCRTLEPSIIERRLYYLDTLDEIIHALKAENRRPFRPPFGIGSQGWHLQRTFLKYLPQLPPANRNSGNNISRRKYEHSSESISNNTTRSYGRSFCHKCTPVTDASPQRVFANPSVRSAKEGCKTWRHTRQRYNIRKRGRLKRSFIFIPF